jgi:hypothetical protein
MRMQRIGLGVAAAGLISSALSMSGCYTRVTRASGFGADQYSVSEPYQRTSALDDWIWGKPQEPRDGTRLR